MPQSIGRFEIRKELGRSAQSVVYLAWDPQLQREVAIKTLQFGQADAAESAALLAVARQAGKLQHPNVVPIFDAGESAGGAYLVSEYVEGRSLAEVLRSEGRMPPGRAADLMRQVADALAQAHAVDIVHRDLKPSNILLDGRGMPRVTDFGVAKRIADEPAAVAQGLAGTPAYMAPEYVARQEVGPSNDLFAAGLILLEMLTGKPVMTGDGVDQILRRVVAEPVEVPRDTGIGDRLADIVRKCCARDPKARYASADLFKQAIEDYVNAGGDAGQGEGDQQGVLEFLLRRMRHKSDFPALSDSVSAINRLMSSEKESITKLSNTILRDYGLTNKILRLVNTAFYRPAGGGNISTVSRAVIVLGFDAVRNITTTLLLFEHLQDKGHGRELKEAFLRANYAALLAREAGATLLPADAEESFICAMFYGLGRLLAQYYFPEEVMAVQKLTEGRGLAENQASARVLGLSFENLGIGIAKNWGFPATILYCMHQLSAEALGKVETRDETLRQIAGFANELCDLVARCTPKDRSKLLRAAVDRYSSALRFTEKQLLATMSRALDELGEFAAILHLNLAQSPFARQIRMFIGLTAEPVAKGADIELDEELAKTVLGYAPGASDDAAARGVPVDAQAVLTAGIQDISNSLVEGFALNDILRIILETMYRAMGFRRVLLCLKDVKTATMAGRFGFGADTADLSRIMRFPLAYEPDVFHLSMQKSLDIIIADVDDPKIAARIPKWYLEKLDAKTFVLFPLSLKGSPVALIYCDKEEAGSIVIPEKELALLKTLRNQAMLAIKQTS